MLDAETVADALCRLAVTHVVWLPDSQLGQWETELERSPLQLVRVCREGEAWAIAAGLWLGGQHPLVMMQSTGLFESGDALRNVLFDLRLPLFALIGYRSYLVPASPDTAKQFTEPMLATWGIDYKVVRSAQDAGLLVDHYRDCAAAGKPGAVLIAEGAM